MNIKMVLLKWSEFWLQLFYTLGVLVILIHKLNIILMNATLVCANVTVMLPACTPTLSLLLIHQRLLLDVINYRRTQIKNI